MWGAVALATTLVGPASGGAQATASMKEVQVADLKAMKSKFARLAEAFPEGSYDWRPMEGVRSVKDVLALMVAETNLFPTMWGTPLPSGAGADFGAEIGRAAALDRAALVAELNEAFDNMISAVEGMDDAGRMKEVNFFGRSTTAGAAVAMGTADMHEHLGQLIAYARMNQIVPPWSRGGM